MKLIDPIVGEFEYEAANTRKALERVTEESFEWRPHPKSWSTVELASHLAEMPSWVGAVISGDEFNVGGDRPYQPFKAENKQELLQKFDESVSQAVEQMRTLSDEAAMQQWTLKRGDQVMFQMPRLAVIKSTIINHAIHHRGQLTVYLRLNDIPVPALYGPSADEEPA